MKEPIFDTKQAKFIEYLFARMRMGKENLPSIAEIGKDLGLSTPNVRELVAVGKALGLISVQPRTGISMLPYDFSTAVSRSVYCAVKTDPEYFDQYSHLRNEIEKSYFLDAIRALEQKDVDHLNEIVHQAQSKLENAPIQIPHEEHRAFHMAIYQNINNVFIEGLLRSYWDLYENVGLNLYTDLSYLRKVWEYHRDIVIAISVEQFENAFELLSEHIDLLYQREIISGSKVNEEKSK